MNKDESRVALGYNYNSDAVMTGGGVSTGWLGTKIEETEGSCIVDFYT